MRAGRLKSVPEHSDIGTRRGELFRSIGRKLKEAHRFFGYFLIAAKSSYNRRGKPCEPRLTFPAYKQNEQPQIHEISHTKPAAQSSVRNDTPIDELPTATAYC